MKKIFFPALALTAGALLFAAAGCAWSGVPYEVASREESENVVLSQGKSQARLMYEEALADGYTGSYMQFLKEIGAAGDSLAVDPALLATVEVYAGFVRAPYAAGSSGYYSIGAGAIVRLDKDGGDAYVVTNYHVVYNAGSSGRETLAHISDSIDLYLYGQKTESRAIRAEYVGGTMEYDIAVLRVEGSEVLKSSAAQAVTFADSDEVAVGERVFAVGNPDGKGISAVSGILSVAAEYITLTEADERTSVSMLEMRTDAPVNHGNSGGGLFNAQGELIGIVNARSEVDGVEHLGYAIPGNLVCAIAENIIDNSKADNSHGAMRASLGITAGTDDSRSVLDAETGRAKIEETVSVREVSNGIAYGKIKVGDILRSIKIGSGAEKKIVRRHMLGVEMFKVRKGDTVTLTLERSGRPVEVSFTFSDNDDFKLFS